jgi:hypothetical protein
VRIPALLLVIPMTLPLLGCAGRAAARTSAGTLSRSVALYESHLDAFIEREKRFYDSRQKEREASERQLLEGQLLRFRVSAASTAAERMIADPTNEVRPAKVTDFMKQISNEETKLVKDLAADQNAAEHQLEGKISALEYKKVLAQRIRLNLSKLSTSGNLAEDSSDLQHYAEQVKQVIDKTKQK